MNSSPDSLRALNNIRTKMGTNRVGHLVLYNQPLTCMELCVHKNQYVFYMREGNRWSEEAELLIRELIPFYFTINVRGKFIHPQTPSDPRITAIPTLCQYLGHNVWCCWNGIEHIKLYCEYLKEHP